MKADPLLEWSRLTNENTKHAVVSSMYLGMLAKSAGVDAFSTWLLAGTGATAALLVANIDSIVSVLDRDGFKVGLVLLVISALLGMFAKMAWVIFP